MIVRFFILPLLAGQLVPVKQLLIRSIGQWSSAYVFQTCGGHLHVSLRAYWEAATSVASSTRTVSSLRIKKDSICPRSNPDYLHCGRHSFRVRQFFISGAMQGTILDKQSSLCLQRSPCIGARSPASKQLILQNSFFSTQLCITTLPTRTRPFTAAVFLHLALPPF